MAPWLNSGDRVRVSPVHAVDLRLGDTIVFLVAEPGSPAGLAVHRLIWRSRFGTRRFWTKGDSSATLDSPSFDGGLIGRVFEYWTPERGWTALESGFAAAAARRGRILLSLLWLLKPAADSFLNRAYRALSGRRSNAARGLRRAVLRASMNWRG